MAMNSPKFGAAGYAVLDIAEPIRNKPPVHLHFGGTAGNVAVIMAALGWESYPFARLPKDDPAFPILTEELRRFGVSLDFVDLTPSAPLPALVQRKRANGSKQPLFTTRCPRCGCRWRGWSPITHKMVKDIQDRLPRFRFFFIDRYTRGNLALATKAKENGALVVFEPTSVRVTDRAESNRFRETLAIADIVKYSRQQFAELSYTDFPRRPSLEIQTRGEDGLRFRRRRLNNTMSPWQSLPAWNVGSIEDPCGAGDWTTAVLLHLIGDQSLDSLADDKLRELLIVAQLAATWACRYMGARGGMYGDPDSLKVFVARWASEYPLSFAGTGGAAQGRDKTVDEAMREFCPHCRGDWTKTDGAIPEVKGEFGRWRNSGRPGYVGKKGAAKQAELNKRFGPGNWRIVYTWRSKVITREQALDLYTDAYIAYLSENRDILNWLVTTARDVYDVEARDVESGTDFLIQDGPAIHLQDIAIRIAVRQLGRNFQGKHLVQIRGKGSVGARLGPGVVPFHEPDSIERPELKGWWKPGTIESFWQSNKMLQVRDWKYRIFVFGGSFNPIHNGHLTFARLARA